LGDGFAVAVGEAVLLFTPEVAGLSLLIRGTRVTVFFGVGVLGIAGLLAGGGTA
jgi:hypothetical protein